MFEERDFLVELEVVLHEKEDTEFLNYVKNNIGCITSRMHNIITDVKNDLHRDDYFLRENLDRMVHMYYTILTLWNSRN